MKTNNLFLLMIGFLVSLMAYSQNQTEIRKKMHAEMMKKNKLMKTYVIEREIPNAGKLSQEELKTISLKSNDVLLEMGPGIEWQHSYVTDNKVFCVYKAENEELLNAHAQKGGFPINAINELSTVINPATAKE